MQPSMNRAARRRAGVRHDGCLTTLSERITDSRSQVCGVEGCGVCLARSMASTQYGATAKLPRAEQLRRIATSPRTCEWFCEECKHSFSSAPETMLRAGRSGSSGCPYCARHNGILCEDRECAVCTSRSVAGNPRALELFDHDRNNIQPWTIMAGSNTRIVWRCREPKCGRTWEARAREICIKHYGCPHCVRSAAEKKVTDFLESTARANFTREFAPTWWDNNRKRFDFLVENLGVGQLQLANTHVILEVDGLQHFEDEWLPEDQRRDEHANDVVKMRAAFQHNHAVVRCLAHTVTKTHGWGPALLAILKSALQSDRTNPTLYLQKVAWPVIASRQQKNNGCPYDRMAGEVLLSKVCRIVWFVL